MPCLGEHCLDPFDGLLQQSLAKPPASTQAQASAEDLSCEMHFKRHGSVNRIQGLNFLAEPLIQQCSILNNKTPMTLAVQSAGRRHTTAKFRTSLRPNIQPSLGHAPERHPRPRASECSLQIEDRAVMLRLM